MRQQQIDHVLTSMLKSHDNVSDLNMTVDKPFQVESSGELSPVSLTPPVDKLTPFQTEIFALNLLGGDRRLTRALLTTFSDRNLCTKPVRWRQAFDQGSLN